MRLIAALTDKSWLSPGLPAAPDAGEAAESGPQPWDRGIGLGVFLLVVTLLFVLLASAYVMRMGGHSGHGGGDWRPLGEPPLLWFNTLLLAASSLAFHVAHRKARGGVPGAAGAALLAGGLIGIAFLAGQFALWRDIAGCFDPAGTAAAFCPAAAHGAAAPGSPASPATAFFILISAMHGLHIFGGLAAWCLAARRLARTDPGSLAARRGAARAVQLCARYWDFMLLVWLAMMGLFVST